MRISAIAAAVLGMTAFVLAADRPNVLIIVGDDHSCQGLGCYGSKIAHTPHLDQLAAQGIRFERAYCNTPMCTPSRQSMLTGRYPQCVGVRDLADALPNGAYTLAHRLAEAGYRTGAFGKMHFNSDKTHGFQTVAGEGQWDAQNRRRKRRPIPAGTQVLGPFKPFVHPARIWLNSMNIPVGLHDEEMRGTWYAEQAIAFMAAPSDRPFYAQIGFHEPHSPYWFPVDFKDRCSPADMLIPTLGPRDREQIPKIMVDLTDDEKRGIIASYFTSVAWLDVNIGRVLEALDRYGLADNTLVIYLGDNGYMLGQHGRFEKHTFYEQAVRVPLMVRLPGRIPAQQSTRAFVEFVDVVPTVLDYLKVTAGPAAAAPRDLHGLSLRPLIEGALGGLRERVFSEYIHSEQAMVRTERYKLIYRSSRAANDWYAPISPAPGRTVRLYDLQHDPEEFNNLAEVPSLRPVIEEGLDQLAAWYRRFPPAGQAPPTGSSEDLLDWALTHRAPTTRP